MAHHLGIALQFAALVCLPVLMIWQLSFGLPLLVMPIGLLAGMLAFGLGTRLRETK
jgi:hypothetical protein